MVGHVVDAAAQTLTKLTFASPDQRKGLEEKVDRKMEIYPGWNFGLELDLWETKGIKRPGIH